MQRISFAWLAPAITAFGKKAGIDAHYYAKNGMLVLVGHTVTILRGIITGYLVARMFEKEIYGEYQFMLSILGMLTLFTLPGLAHSVTRAWARKDAFSAWGITKMQLKICGIASVILLLCIPFLGMYQREELSWLFLTAAILFPLSPVAMVRFGGFTVGQARFDLALRATIVSSIFMILATTAVILLHQSALLMLVLSLTLTPLVQLYYSRKLRPPAAETSEANTKAIVRYGWQLTFATLPVDLVWYLDKLLISHFFGLSQLALFSVALLIPEQFKLLAKQFLPVTFAKQAVKDDSWARRMHLVRIVLACTGIFAIGIAAYILVAPWIMPLLFPNYDARQITILTSVAAATLITVPGGLFSQYLEARGMIWEVRYSTWIAAAVFAVSLLILIPTYGVVGAVLARGVFRFMNWGTACWYVVRAPIRQSGVGSLPSRPA